MPAPDRDLGVTPDDIERAARTIAGHALETPTLGADQLSEIAGTPVFLKAENLQVTGSFKIRGATNAVANLSDEERAAGVVALTQTSLSLPALSSHFSLATA